MRDAFARLRLEKHEGEMLSLRDFFGPEGIRGTQRYHGRHSSRVAGERANRRLCASPARPNGTRHGSAA